MGWRNTILGQDEDPCPHARPGKYCPDCGLLMQLPRLGYDSIFGAKQADWEQKSFRRTLFGLLLKPGASIRTYLFVDRNYLTKPATYLLIAMAFRLWVDHLLGASETCAAGDGFCQMWAEEATSLRFIQIGLFALVYRLAFRKAGLNLWEYGTGFAYIVAQSGIISGVLSLALWLVDPQMRVPVVFVVQTLYMILATIQFLQITGRWRTAGAIVLGLLTLAAYLGFIVWLGENWLDTPPAPATDAAPAIAAPPG